MFDTYNINNGVAQLAPDSAIASQNIGGITDSIEQQRQNIDESSVRKLMRYLNVDMMESYFRIGPSRVKGQVFDIYNAWNNIINSSAFCIYDTELRNAIIAFFFAWDEIIRKGIPYYSPSHIAGDFVFGHAEFDMFDSPEQEQCFDEIMKKWYGTAIKFGEMMNLIKQRYAIEREDIGMR